jgi:hypothetical protein
MRRPCKKSSQLPLAPHQNLVFWYQRRSGAFLQGWPSHDATTQLSSKCFLPYGAEAEGQVEVEIAHLKKQIMDGKGEFSIPLGQETDMTLIRELREQTLV